MSDVRVSDATGTRPREFNLDAYAARSFGVSQEEQHDVVLRFHASARRVMAWHLFTWGDAVRIEGPEELCQTMRDMLRASQRALHPGL